MSERIAQISSSSTTSSRSVGCTVSAICFKLLLHPLPAPCWSLERVCKVLRLVYNLAVPELHDAHCKSRPSLVRDGVLRNPQITRTENTLDLKPRWLAGMMTAQRLQISPSQDPLSRLRIIADRVIIVNIVLCVQVARRRRTPMCIQCL